VDDTSAPAARSAASGNGRVGREEGSDDVDVQEILARATDAAQVGRVFGEPIERDGVVVIPAATVRGGAGGGSGRQDDGSEQGSGGGIGLVARPAGVYVIRDGDVHWRPALDLNRVILGGQAVAAVALLVVRSLLRRRGSRFRR
jgi:uncharacterized spore protein YtfJ